MANTPSIDVFHEGDQWKVNQQGNQRASSTHATKAEAVGAGRDIARDRGAGLAIKKMDVPIGSRGSHGRDPNPSRG